MTKKKTNSEMTNNIYPLNVLEYQQRLDKSKSDYTFTVMVYPFAIPTIPSFSHLASLFRFALSVDFLWYIALFGILWVYSNLFMFSDGSNCAWQIHLWKETTCTLLVYSAQFSLVNRFEVGMIYRKAI